MELSRADEEVATGTPAYGLDLTRVPDITEKRGLSARARLLKRTVTSLTCLEWEVEDLFSEGSLPREGLINSKFQTGMS